MIRTMPQDLEAEKSAINIALNLGRIPEALDDLRPEDFYQPAHEKLWQVMRWLLRKGSPCDPIAVHARLMETHQVNLLGLLPEFISGPWSGNPETVVAIIIDRSCRRHIIEAAERTLQNAYESTEDCENILQKAEQELAKVPARDSGETDSVQTMSEFLGSEIPQPDWVIDGLMARGERVIITGEEGLGKSTLCRQLAVCSAAGIEPFSGKRIDPRTVLLIDAENPKFILQKRFSELRQAVNAHGGQISDTRFWIDRKPEGLNLAEAGDRRWLQRRVKLIRPELIVIGPAYKLHQTSNDDKDEVIARTITTVLDDLRGDAALVLEHHAGNEQAGMARPVRPFGSSLWRRWPEFGYGIRRATVPKRFTAAEREKNRFVDLIAWRGARDERAWPRQLGSGGRDMPWVETVVPD